MSGPLKGLRVLDMTRILAGPTCTQLLGDLGADVIKIERPGEGDDTRRWGPPYVRNADGSDSDASAYFLSSNRNKRSLSIDMAHPEGQALIRRLAESADFAVENFKVGGLSKFGLDYFGLKQVKPDLIYCSVTGFGQDGPYAPRAGYDYLAQGMGGMMSLTGEPDGKPMKIGVGIADVMCGMYATVALLAALHHRDKTGRGQYIDLALLDTQVAWLVNEGLNYLTSGEVPHRRGTEHANIVPYNVLPTADGHLILAVGNDRQFQRFCEFAGAPELAADPRFLTNSLRVANRKALYEILPRLTARKTLDDWVEGLAQIGVPSGPVNTLDRVFADPQILHRGMKIELPYPGSEKGSVSLIGNPIKFSETPVDYRRPPPHVGQHSDEVLSEVLGLDAAEIARLRDEGVV
ncbi:Crotonobetainyl-CoA:carnitine CoA-transferase CaiB [Tistlia consotensis]|uniref:Crotonobetainyl-CoA:carnitine CoA-transferase CaiB n=1 Tax=Tistlia consotensis USBA 355 TaxID=560819 RepID=A0A1Y6C8R5_9PROT|nr:CaiB/BaiF CoA-transferase family protein [Tistlia consotensis]SMF48104.1 Crotonobetainyl-CoA:carnitine CoA-transferase CaiB [Tistlia consotensis USBA 355]SNR81850.1 Crotonobetainyl-CoA:carnitine CoA-transferase CaiB [Tistlia consotensis]